MSRSCFRLFFLALLGVSAPVHAQSGPSPTSDANTRPGAQADAQAGAADEAPARLENLTIFGETETLTRAVGSAHALDAEQLEAFGYDNINRVLKQIPGLYIRGEDGYGLRPNIGLRGANSDRSQKVTLMEDGVLFGPAPYAAPAAYYFPLTRRLQGVEVYKGPAAIRFGPQTIGGAINLVSAPVPRQTAGSLSVAGGSDAYRRGHLRAGTTTDGGTGVFGEVVHIGTDGFKDLDGGGETGFDKTEAVAKLSRQLGGGELTLRVDVATEGSDETYLGLTESDFRADPVRRYRASARDYMGWDRHGVRADYDTVVWGGDLRLTAYDHRFDRAWTKFNNFRDADVRDVLANPDTPRNRVFYQHLTGETDTDPNFDGDDLLIGTNDRSFRSSGLQGQWSSRWGAHTVSTGIRLHSDRIRRLHDELAFEMTDGRLVRNDAPRAITADNTARADALAVWATDRIALGRWLIVPGLRIEAVRTEFADRLAGASNDNETVVALPGIGVNFAASDDLTWLAGVHRGFSPASPGLTDTDPEDAVNVEAGLRWTPSPVSLEVVAFYSDYRNLTAICTFSTGCDDARLGEQANAGRVVVHGTEVTAGWVRPLTRAWSLTVDAGYTYTHGEFREAFESTNPQFGDVEVGFELPYVPEHRANLVAGLQAPRWQADVSVSYLSAMRDTAGEGRIDSTTGSDAHTVIDLAGRVELTRRLALTARIDNLLDREYVVARRPFGARPGRPISGLIGLDWRWR